VQLFFIELNMSGKWDSYSFVFKRVTKHGKHLQYASKKLQDDERVVLAAVTNCPASLQFASDRLKSSKQILLVAVSKNGNALDYVNHASLSADAAKLIYETAVNTTANAIRYIPSNMQTFELVNRAVYVNPKLIAYISEYTDDYDLILHCAKHCATLLRYASARLRDDETIALAATYYYGGLYYVSDRLRANKHVVLRAVSHNSVNIMAVSSEQLLDDHDIATAICGQNYCVLDKLSTRIRTNKNIMLMAAKNINISQYLKNNPLMSDGHFIVEYAKLLDLHIHNDQEQSYKLKKINKLAKYWDNVTIYEIAALIMMDVVKPLPTLRSLYVPLRFWFS